MPTELAVIILAVAALFTGALYLMTRRRRRKKKSAPPVRPAAPTGQTAGVASTWAPPPAARPTIAPTVVVQPGSSPSWDQPASSQAKPGSTSPAWGAPAAPPGTPSPTWGSPAAPPTPAGPPPPPPAPPQGAHAGDPAG